VNRVPVPVVLASKSPQRRTLLATLVDEFEVVAPEVDENAADGEDADALARRLAEAKAEQVAEARPDALVIAADTVVECRGRLIGKPLDRSDAIRILTELTSHPHRVLTGLCVIAPDGRRRSIVSVARVHMKRLTRDEIERYVDSEDVLGRAGAYGLKELDPNVRTLEGSRSAVMGLPTEELAAVLASLYSRGEGA